MAEKTRGRLVASLKGLYKSAEYSDFTITCGAETFRVHKAIVCSQSEFFKRAERFPVRSEATNDTIDLPEDDPAIVKLLVQYLYEAEYEPMLTQLDSSQRNAKSDMVPEHSLIGFHYSFPHTCSDHCPSPMHMVCQHHECRDTTCRDSCINFVCEKCCPNYISIDLEEGLDGDASQLILHSKMYEIGDKYGIFGLKHLAESKFICACAQWWDTEYFAPAADHAFSSTPDNDKGLRDVVSTTISHHMKLLKKPEVEAVLNEFNGLAVSVMKFRAEELGWI